MGEKILFILKKEAKHHNQHNRKERGPTLELVVTLVNRSPHQKSSMMAPTLKRTTPDLCTTVPSACVWHGEDDWPPGKKPFWT